MSTHEAVSPEGWKRPKGYSNGILAAPGRTLFIAGQIGWDVDEKLVSSDFLPQYEKALANMMAVLIAAGGKASDLCRITTYVTDKKAYVAEIQGVGLAYRQRIGRHFPAMSLVVVKDLLEEGALVEIEATAVIASEKEST